MEDKFYYHLHCLISIRQRTIILTMVASILLVSLFISFYNLGLYPFAYGSLFVLLVLIINLLFIHSFKSLHYYKSLYALPIDDEAGIRELLDQVVDEARSLKGHFFLKRQAKHFLGAVYAFECLTLN